MVGSRPQRAAILVALLAPMMLLGIWSLHHGRASSNEGLPQATTASPIVSQSSASYGIESWAIGLSADQVLDHGLSQPGPHQVVRGVAGKPSVMRLPNSEHPLSDSLATDFPFVVTAFFGNEPSPYSIGKTIALRIPGGSSGGVTESVEDAPHISAGEELYVFVSDPGPFSDSEWGVSTDTLLVAVDSEAVFEVHNGVVSGRVAASRLREPVATFEQHFRR